MSNSNTNKNTITTKEIQKQLADANYDFALAFATEPEIKAGAACGQLSIIVQNKQ